MQPITESARHRAIIFSTDLSKPQLAEIELVCKQLGVSVLASVREVEELTTLPGAPHFVFGGLTTGRRSVPGNIAAVADTYRETVVVLLSSEPLVRPVVALAAGRVLVVSPPHSNVNLSRAMRHVLRDGAASVFDTAKGLDGAGAKVLAHASTSARTWFGTLSTTKDAQGSLVGPVYYADGSGKVAIGLSSDAKRPFTAAFLQFAHDKPEDFAKIMSGALGSSFELPESYLVAALNREQNEWRIFRKGSVCDAWLLSPFRLPSAYWLSKVMRHKDQMLWTKEAMVGDVLIAATGSPAADQVHIQCALTHSGAAYYEQVASQLNKSGEGCQTVAIEVL
jgi:hypothetical protein